MVKNVYYGNVTINQSPVKPSDDRKPAATTRKVFNPYAKKVSTQRSVHNTNTSFSTNSTSSSFVTPVKLGTPRMATRPNPYKKKVNVPCTPTEPVVLNNVPVHAVPKNPVKKKSCLKKKNCVTFDFSGVKNMHFAEIKNNFSDNSCVVSDGCDSSDDVFESDFMTQPKI